MPPLLSCAAVTLVALCLCFFFSSSCVVALMKICCCCACSRMCQPLDRLSTSAVNAVTRPSWEMAGLPWDLAVVVLSAKFGAGLAACRRSLLSFVGYKLKIPFAFLVLSWERYLSL